MFKALFDVFTQKNLLLQAMARAEKAFELSHQTTQAAFAFTLRGEKPGFDVYAVDREINAAEIEVRRLVFEHMVTHPRGDITTSLILISTIIDVERIGDYSKNVYEQGVRLGGPWPTHPAFATVPALVVLLEKMFEDTSVAVKQNDRQRAQATMSTHQELKKGVEQVLVAISQADGLHPREAVVGALTVRFAKRIGAHLGNLSSSVINPFDRIGFRPEPPKA